MFGSSDVQYRYHHDSVTRRVVDMLRSFLGSYHMTPGELREAVILAATMHEAENIRPLFIALPKRGAAMDDLMPYYITRSLEPPAMFGGLSMSVGGYNVWALAQRRQERHRGRKRQLQVHLRCWRA